MVRTPLTPAQLAAGRRLGEQLRQARGARTLAHVAQRAGVSAETLRKIETGRMPTPAFTTVVALARVLSIPLDQLADVCLAETGLQNAG
ncbi:helix-turn-helix transcriptional regulator [Gordonia sinesedis]